MVKANIDTASGLIACVDLAIIYDVSGTATRYFHFIAD